MTYPTFLLQPPWVLESASADQGNAITLNKEPTAEALGSWAWIEPGWQAWQLGDRSRALHLWREAMENHPADLLLQRVVNRHEPALLHQAIPQLSAPEAPAGIAFVLPGELRCLEQSRAWLNSLTGHGDVFICTSAAYADVARSLDGEALILDAEPDLPVGSMQQWHKLAMVLAQVRARERCTGRKYTHILKLRSDFHHVQPASLLRDLVAADGIVCASDKVFGGPRDVMLLFEAFHAASLGWFAGREGGYWPINLGQILRSDASAKWYGMAFPRELIGQPATIAAFRQVLEQGGEPLARALLEWRPPSGDAPQSLYWRLFKGHPLFASEVCFARFLNFNGIASHSCPALVGFLRHDRLGASPTAGAKS